MKKPVRGIRFMLVLAACILGSFLWSGRGGRAAVKDVQVINGNTSELTVTIGDTGHIQPVADTLMTDAGGLPVTVARWEYDSYQEEIVRVDPNGYYEALSYGKTTICVYGYTELGVLVFRGSCHVMVCVDMTNATLETDQLTGYVTGYGSYTGKIRINSSVLLNEDNSVMTYQSDEPAMSVSCEMINNELSISAYGEGSAKLTVVINGKEFLISFKVIRLEMSKTGLVASRGKKTKLYGKIPMR